MLIPFFPFLPSVLFPASPTPTEMKTTDSNKDAQAGCMKGLVRPRRETPKWSLLGELLDEIHSQADNEAIYAGFVHGNTKRLDAALERIQKAATEARAILRPNNTPPKTP